MRRRLVWEEGKGSQDAKDLTASNVCCQSIGCEPVTTVCWLAREVSSRGALLLTVTAELGSTEQ